MSFQTQSPYDHAGAISALEQPLSRVRRAGSSCVIAGRWPMARL